MSAEVTILQRKARYDLDDLTRFAVAPLEASSAILAVAFGSYARGTADGYSDLDLAVVMRTDRPFWERSSLLSELHAAMPLAVDLLVYTPEEFARGVKRGYGVFHAIGEEGIRIFER